MNIEKRRTIYKLNQKALHTLYRTIHIKNEYEIFIIITNSHRQSYTHKLCYIFHTGEVTLHYYVYYFDKAVATMPYMVLNTLDLLDYTKSYNNQQNITNIELHEHDRESLDKIGKRRTGARKTLNKLLKEAKDCPLSLHNGKET